MPAAVENVLDPLRELRLRENYIRPVAHAADYVPWRDYESSLPIAREALQTAEALGEPELLNEARISLGLSMRAIGRTDEATALFSAALESVIAIGSAEDAERLRVILAMTAVVVGDPKRARDIFDDILTRLPPSSDVRLDVLFGMSLTELLDGHPRLARDHVVAAARVAYPNVSRAVRVQAVEVMAAIESALDHPEAALRLGGAGEAFRKADGSIQAVLSTRMLNPYLDKARRRMDSGRADVLWGEGGRMSLEEAHEYFMTEHTS